MRKILLAVSFGALIASAACLALPIDGAKIVKQALFTFYAWPVNGAGTPVPAYGNPGGTGDRTASITVTSNLTPTGGTLAALIDGTTGSGGATFTTSRGWYLQFDFGSGNEKCINAFKYYASATTATGGQWVFEASDGNGFWDILTTVTFGTTATEEFTFTNIKRYRYYRLRKDLTNTGPGTVTMREIEFKIDNVGSIATPDSTVQSYGQKGGMFDRSAVITITTTATVASGAIGNFIDGVSPTTTASTSNAFKFTAGGTTKEIKFDFGASYSPKITEFTIFESLNENEGTWKLAGSNDDSSYTDLSTPTVWNGTGAAGQTISFANTTAYRYYKLIQTAGTNGGSAFQMEICFKLGT
jgi:hypothetical protein